jgi:hypothetical protein
MRAISLWARAVSASSIRRAVASALRAPSVIRPWLSQGGDDDALVVAQPLDLSAVRGCHHDQLFTVPDKRQWGPAVDP